MYGDRIYQTDLRISKAFRSGGTVIRPTCRSTTCSTRTRCRPTTRPMVGLAVADGHHAGEVRRHWSASRLLNQGVEFTQRHSNSQLPTRFALLGLGVGLCFLDRLSARADARSDVRRSHEPARLVVTFNKDIAPILFENCATCHRPIDSSAAFDCRRLGDQGAIRYAWRGRRFRCWTTRTHELVPTRSPRRRSRERCLRGSPNRATASSSTRVACATSKSR